MRVVGLLSLVLALAVVGWLAQRQLAAHRATASAQQPPSAAASARQQSQPIQRQYQQALDSALQSPAREMPADAR
ncbi:MAG: hypothetical protein J0L74_01185 [Burkholderiales bacterium]|nr:hypothetical protein [Burkholderiales bacterium]